MPFKSEAQRRWAHTEEGSEALGGKSAVEHWEEETEGKKLPERKGKDKAVKLLDKALKLLRG